MKKDKLSINAWITEAEANGQSMQEFLIDYNAKELECSKEELLAKMERMLVVIKESIDFGLTGVRSHSGLTGGDAKRLQEASEEKQSAIF